jgi:coatomer subunit beta
MSEPSRNEEISMSNLRTMVVEGDIFLCSILASTFTKFCLRKKDKKMTVKSLLAMCGFVKMAEVKSSSQKSAHTDCHERITLCCRMLLDSKTSDLLSKAWTDSGKQTFSQLLVELRAKAATECKEESAKSVTQCDDLIHIRQLKNTSGSAGDIDLDDGSDLLRATGQGKGSKGGFSAGFKNCHQLTGFSDPVYCEASIIVNDYDIKLSMILINRTSDPVSVSVELSTIGDMKIVERPQNRTIAPLDQVRPSEGSERSKLPNAIRFAHRKRRRSKTCIFIAVGYSLRS